MINTEDMTSAPERKRKRKEKFLLLRSFTSHNNILLICRYPVMKIAAFVASFSAWASTPLRGFKITMRRIVISSKLMNCSSRVSGRSLDVLCGECCAYTWKTSYSSRNSHSSLQFSGWCPLRQLLLVWKRSTEDGHSDEHGLVLPPYGFAFLRAFTPWARLSYNHSCSILLLCDSRHCSQRWVEIVMNIVSVNAKFRRDLSCWYDRAMHLRS